jgi:hypothetical protein
LDTIREITFCRKVDEWPSWSEKFLSKAKKYGFQDLLLGKLSIPWSDEEFNVISDFGKEKSRIFELNEIAFTKLILLIDVKTSSSKTAFKAARPRIVWVAIQLASTWERLKNKDEPISAPTLVQLEYSFENSH